MQLLIVNDERLTADTMKQEIDWESLGIHRVYTAYDAEQAKAVFAEEKIDIALCDIEMPGENGIELLRWIRAQGLDTECIYLTCHASFEYAKEAIDLGCRSYILIPARDEEVCRVVKETVELIRRREAEKRYQELGKSAVTETVERGEEQYGQKKSPEELVKEAVEYIGKNLQDEELSVNRVADHLALHPVYLNRIFKKEKETSLGQYIIAERMKLAEALLMEGKLSAYAVSEMTGYHNYSNFVLSFRKTFGMPPTQYVKQKKGNAPGEAGQTM